MKYFHDARDEFFDMRWGLWLHFGLYSIEGWHEQDQMRRRIPRAKYVKLVDRFNPTRFDPEAILDLAESVGMKYISLTTKHHDGFCLWNTAETDYNAVNTPYGRDVVRQLADACHRRHFPLGLYYSVVDWHHPNYPNQARHHELPPQPGDTPDWDKYMAFLRRQVRELCTNYGKIAHFFWDINVPEHRDPTVNQMIRDLQPGIVINDRGFDEGDFGTPEREYQQSAVNALRRFERPTEACNSVGRQSWGYREQEDYYTIGHLIRSMDAMFARGANYLLNVGPDATGRIPEKAASILRRIGDWRRRVGEAFDDCEPAGELTGNSEVLLTRRDKTLYVHQCQPLQTEAILLYPLTRQPARAVLLNTGRPVETAVDVLPIHWQSAQPCLRIRNLPVDDLREEAPVIRLEFDGPIEGVRETRAAEFKG
jgi:alpha-L-fucosidase